MPFMKEERKFNVSKLLFAEFLDKFNFTFEELRALNDNQFEGKEPGSAVMITGELFVTIWIGINNVTLMIGKEEIKSFKFLMINE